MKSSENLVCINFTVKLGWCIKLEYVHGIEIGLSVYCVIDKAAEVVFYVYDFQTAEQPQQFICYKCDRSLNRNLTAVCLGHLVCIKTNW